MSFISHVAASSCFSFFTNFLCKSDSNGTDDEDFEPQDFSAKQSDKWEGEDEEDNDVKVRILSSINIPIL